jgi:hypothetical protein
VVRSHPFSPILNSLNAGTPSHRPDWPQLDGELEADLRRSACWRAECPHTGKNHAASKRVFCQTTERSFLEEQPDAPRFACLGGIKTGRLHVATLMKRMGIEAIYRKPNTSKPGPGHKIYPNQSESSPGYAGVAVAV